jgi:hypothetical protein
VVSRKMEVSWFTWNIEKLQSQDMNAKGEM